MEKRFEEPIRFVTATALFDGHDASINIMRRLLQDAGAEVIHLGHNRGVQEIARAAVQEGAQAIAVSSYQGGHMEFFKYLIDLLEEKGCGYVKVFGGGGGVIVPDEITELEAYGVAKIYSPLDGKRLGLKGMIDHMIGLSREVRLPEIKGDLGALRTKNPALVGRLINLAEQASMGINKRYDDIRKAIKSDAAVPVVGITGTGGSGKSSFIDELVRRFLNFYPEKSVAIIAVDPTRSKSGGALLGDRIRMNAIEDDRVYVRSLATRLSPDELSIATQDALSVVKAAGYDLVLVETSGIGQGDTAVTRICDCAIYVMTAEYGAPSQLEKIDMLDYADMVVINKFEQERSQDALRDVRKQYMRNHNLFDRSEDDLPVFGTVASRYDDSGTDRVFAYLMRLLKDKSRTDWELPAMPETVQQQPRRTVVPPGRDQYLRSIAQAVRAYHDHTRKTAEAIRSAAVLKALLKDSEGQEREVLQHRLQKLENGLSAEDRKLIESWSREKKRYTAKTFSYEVRGKEIRVPLASTSLSGLEIPRVALPDHQDEGEVYRFKRKENLPGQFPYTAGVFPFKRDWEDPKRQFAGEGTPERTNKRFHYLCRNDDAKRLSTAFDSVTLYGEDPHERPDIFGKIGESGVSVCTVEDMGKLYAGFDLCSPLTSVSMTINGPAAWLSSVRITTR